MRAESKRDVESVFLLVNAARWVALMIVGGSFSANGALREESASLQRSQAFLTGKELFLKSRSVLSGETKDECCVLLFFLSSPS